MSGGSTQDSLRKVLGAIKDSTTVGLAQINSDYKDLDVAIVKATNHVECPPKEKHVRIIFAATSVTRPRADVAYCIHAIGRRLAKTHNWAVAIKALILIHRILREGDPTFKEELVNYARSRGLVFNLSHFKDDSSPSAWDYSAWIRSYALFLEERLECYRIIKYDLEFERVVMTKEFDTIELLEHMPAMQQLLQCVIGCQPEGAAFSNYVIQYALNLVLKESIKLYLAINDGMINLVDKFFDMQRHDAVKALEIYKRGGYQTEKLSEFYDVCKGLDFSRSMKLPPLEQPPQSFLASMEQYVRDAPHQSTAARRDMENGLKKTLSIPALEYHKPAKQEEPSLPPPPMPPKEVDEKPEESVLPAVPSNESVDFLGLDDVKADPSALEDSNALALAIVPDSTTIVNDDSKEFNKGAAVTGWELALVTSSSSNDSAINQSKLAGGLDHLTLDGLYDDATTRHAYGSTNTYCMDHLVANPFQSTLPRQMPQQDPFFASNHVAPPTNVQMAAFAQQQQAVMMQQQMMLGIQQPTNSYGYGMAPYMTSVSHPQGTMQTNPFGNPGLL